jgi:hypothetical protein
MMAGVLKWKVKEYGESIKYLELALYMKVKLKLFFKIKFKKNKEKLFSKTHFETANILNNIGVVYDSMNLYDDAIMKY